MEAGIGQLFVNFLPRWIGFRHEVFRDWYTSVGKKREIQVDQKDVDDYMNGNLRLQKKAHSFPPPLQQWAFSKLMKQFLNEAKNAFLSQYDDAEAEALRTSMPYIAKWGKPKKQRHMNPHRQSFLVKLGKEFQNKQYTFSEQQSAATKPLTREEFFEWSWDKIHLPFEQIRDLVQAQFLEKIHQLFEVYDPKYVREEGNSTIMAAVQNCWSHIEMLWKECAWKRKIENVR